MVLIKVLIFTGLRNSELAKVKLQDVDLDHCQIGVDPTVVSSTAIWKQTA
jgi:integrase